MRALMSPAFPHQKPGEPAAAVLRQRYEPRLPAELAALADELARLVLEGEEELSDAAASALVGAAQADGEGIPYPGALRALVRVYETLRSREDHAGAARQLFNIAFADIGYVRNVFRQTERPPPCRLNRRVILRDAVTGRILHDPLADPDVNLCPNVSAWCDAGRLLLALDKDAVDGPRREEFDPLCEGGRTIIS